MSEWLVLNKANSISRLPVSLAIELVRSDEDSALFFICFEQHAICRNSAIFVHLEDIADSEFLAGHFLHPFRPQHFVHSVVQLFISLVALEVIPSFFDHSDREHEGQGSQESEQES